MHTDISLKMDNGKVTALTLIDLLAAFHYSNQSIHGLNCLCRMVYQYIDKLI